MSIDHVEEVTGDSGGEEQLTATTSTTAASATVTAAVRYYSIAPGVRLNVRSGPSTSYGIVRVLPEGSKVPIFCQTPGQTISGPYGTTNLWDNIADGEYISDAYVYTGVDGYVAGRCG
ncbi:SH3 domain-containing protein [Streptomyces ipomoeae]|uniref:SH3 domain-containing protein n=1 Tax=Streptomyces ipomoeae TaxID=103232 RepID=A0AAE8VTR3_9ACTN|nr:SH3 domain-containing protein [Streptomyces ipomoeae]TQE15707.1 SH3 domain-containing protein [Streptomyces ipomoeae]